jgi:tail collar domain
MNLTDHLLKTITESILPSGIIQLYGGETPPEGWAFCNGDAVSRSGNPSLYTQYGTKYGEGDGTTTFNLPDLRGRFPAGHDIMGGAEPAGRLTGFSTHGVNATILGATGGHERLDSTYDNGVTEGGGNFSFQTAEDMNNVPPAIVLNFIVRLG